MLMTTVIVIVIASTASQSNLTFLSYVIFTKKRHKTYERSLAMHLLLQQDR